MVPKASNLSDRDPKKRKSNQPLTGREKKRAKVLDARRLSTQTSGYAYGNGEVDVAKFVKAREYEIKALQDGLRDAKKMLSSRAFQEVPRSMRRRTASHNPNRVPKKLRPRAKREMAEDNTPVVNRRNRKLTGKQRLRQETVKRLQNLSARSRARKAKKALARLESSDKIKVTAADDMPAAVPPATSQIKTRKARVKTFVLKAPDLPPAKFRKRQKNKTWLPTHLYHTKRARMTPSAEPLWRFSMPLTPSEKCYRATHRATTQKGGVAWDMSYMSTISVEGVENSVKGLLRGLGVPLDPGLGNAEDHSKNRTAWLRGTRVWHGWVYERDSDPKEAIAPVAILWRSPPKPSGTEMDVDAGEQPNKKRQLFLRVHPSAFLQLWTQVVRLAKVQKPAVSVEDVRYEIGSIEVTGPSALEAMIGTLRPGQDDASRQDFNALWTVLAAKKPGNVPGDALFAFDVYDSRLNYPPKRILSSDENAKRAAGEGAASISDDLEPSASLFDRQARRAASASMLTQSVINRRKSLAVPGEGFRLLPTDPLIPIVMYASPATVAGRTTWTLLLPWRYVTAVWRCLMHYPLHSGGNLRLGGLNEKRQVHFENKVPWFPGDFPGTQAGRSWELLERQKRQRAWERRPKGKRTEFDSLDLGHGTKGELGQGWACDWEFVAGLSAKKDEESTPTDVKYHHMDSSQAAELLSGDGPFPDSQANAIAIVRFTMVNKGVPQPCARVYRLPSNDSDLLQAWLRLELAGKPRRPLKDESGPYSYVEGDRPAGPKPGDPHYPKVPGEEDLIGFVTTGNLNLTEGMGTGLGGLMLRKLVPDTTTNRELRDSRKSHERLCIIRTPGERFGRLARWKFV